MSILGTLLGGGVTSIIQAGNEVVKTVRGDKSAVDAAIHKEMLGVQAAYMAETAKPSLTWWDSFVDGLNRLVRPICTFGAIWLMVWAAVDPASFQITMAAYASVPQWLWAMVTTIFVFWFGGRAAQDVMQKRAAPLVQKAVADTAAAVSAKAAEEVVKASPTSDANNPTMARFKAKRSERKEPKWDARSRKWIKE